VSENINQLGYSVEEFVSGRKKFSEIVHPQDLDRVIQEVGEYTAKKLKSFTQQYRVFTREGDTCWVDDYTVTRCNAAGEDHWVNGCCELSAGSWRAGTVPACAPGGLLSTSPQTS
jgi:PAS domain-containing protein